VRIANGVATIAIKSRRRGPARTEFEYAIPYSDAEEMLRTMCGGNVLDKVRHFVSDAGNTWQIDVYEGLLEGVVLAEIELTDADQKLTLPDWIGEEVTADPTYRKVNMVRGALRQAKISRQNDVLIGVYLATKIIKRSSQSAAHAIPAAAQSAPLHHDLLNFVPFYLAPRRMRLRWKSQILAAAACRGQPGRRHGEHRWRRPLLSSSSRSSPPQGSSASTVSWAIASMG